MNLMLRTTLITLVFVIPAVVQSQDTYKMPPPEVAALVDAPATPSVSISPDRSYLLRMDQPGVPTITDLAQPELRLAGIRINPANNGPSRSGYITGLTLLNLNDASEKVITGLPSNPVIQNVSWAPDGKTIAFTHSTATEIQLWTADVASARAKRLGNFRINNTWFGAPFSWYPDSRALLVRVIPGRRGTAPQADPAPKGPVIQESLGDAAPVRTYQDLLANPHDEALFEYYFTSQLMRVEMNGRGRTVGAPALFGSIQISPNGNMLLVSSIKKPYSYLVPASRFPVLTEVWDNQGKVVYTVEELPLLDNIPIAFNSTHEGRRSITWRNDANATLFWVEAADGGDPRKAAAIRDRAYLLEAPFRGEPKLLAELETRYAGVTWGSENLALISESWRANRRTKTWRVQPGNPSAEKQLMIDRNYEDRYADPGSPVMRPLPSGNWVMHTTNNGQAILMSGQGASPEGNRPFLASYFYEEDRTEVLWRSEAPYYEVVSSVMNDEASKIITRREGVKEFPNYFMRDLSTGIIQPITDFPHPYPHLMDVSTEFISFERSDGVTLTGQLLLPAGYSADQGTLPLVIWAYPREFASAAAAGQVSDSPYRFSTISYWGPQFLVTQGYAVLNNASMPIVPPSPDIEPNDSFIEQLTANAQAAIDEMVRRGVSDGERIAVGGHSYGAFMTANLLAHTRLFKAGIARSGAYNRSLTPFGFQAEPRNIWEATDIYITMSPFFHADNIKTPLLFIHGEADNNSGTFPIQSERMYQAIKGLGGTTRLVMLPHESHGYRARESLMHMLWETITWLDTYVK